MVAPWFDFYTCLLILIDSSRDILPILYKHFKWRGYTNLSWMKNRYSIYWSCSVDLIVEIHPTKLNGCLKKEQIIIMQNTICKWICYVFPLIYLLTPIIVVDGSLPHLGPERIRWDHIITHTILPTMETGYTVVQQVRTKHTFCASFYFFIICIVQW